MVCVPCFVIPALLWVFYKFINPWLSRFWGNSENYVLSNLTCPAPVRKKKENANGDDQSKLTESESETSENGKAKANGHENLGERLKAE